MLALEGRRVFIVDDDAGQAETLATLLRWEGLETASEVVPAAALARAIADPPDALIVNVKMPGQYGTDLLATVRERHPSLPALLMTGFEQRDPLLAPFLRWDRVSYLGKPVEVREVLAALARVLAEPAADA